MEGGAPAAAAAAGSVHASLMGFRGGGPAAKKQRRTALVVIDGDDATTANHDDVRRWRQIVMAAQGRPWADEEFPAVQLSIDGKEAAPATAPAAGSTPRCRCGTAATKATVTSATPNQGRPYYRCATRACGFFAWADGKVGAGASSKGPLNWERFPRLPIVSDYGFSAQDLRQGGVGDCWFMSALAVVAERHDLIARLFADTAINPAGCYLMRFFLDGEWKSILVDDRLPVTSNPRRPDLAFASKLAFSRCGDGKGGPSDQMLWACLLEKAYAKAHGSYKSTSGGEIAEALLDLTGAPTLSVDFNSSSFDSELLWRSMVEWKRLGLPMGCATSSDDTSELREVGLCGSHAYSVLSVREVTLHEAGRLKHERLVHVRNPHGVGEWNGDWSDRSEKWASVIASSEGGTGRGSGVDDGTFFIDWTHFLMGFSIVEVCLAHRGWHCRSLANAFPDKSSSWRVCEQLYRVKARADGGQKTTLYLMALQPTKRGAWCRADRKKSYRPGDVSVLVARLGADGGVEEVVGGGLRGAESRPSNAFALDLERGCEYLVIPFCLGANPTAAETTKAQPFHVRFYSSTPLEVTPQRFDQHEPEHQTAALQTLLQAAVVLEPPRHAAGFAAAGDTAIQVGRRDRKLRRRMLSGKENQAVRVMSVMGDGVILLVAANQSRTAVEVDVTAFTKSNVARTLSGKLVSDTAAANAFYERQKAAEEQEAAEREARERRNPDGGGARLITRKASKSRGGFRWPAKWQAFTGTATLQPERASLVMVLVKSGMQATLGHVEATVKQPSGAPEASSGAQKARGVQTSLHSFLAPGGAARPRAAGAGVAAQAAGAVRDGIFSPVPIHASWAAALLRVAEGQDAKGARAAAQADDGLAQALQASKEEADMAAAMEASRREHGSGGSHGDDSAELERAIAASLRGGHSAPKPAAAAAGEIVELLSSDEEDEEDAAPAMPAAAGLWQCPVCTFGGNASEAPSCEVCTSSRQ